MALVSKERNGVDLPESAAVFPKKLKWWCVDGVLSTLAACYCHDGAAGVPPPRRCCRTASDLDANVAGDSSRSISRLRPPLGPRGAPGVLSWTAPQPHWLKTRAPPLVEAPLYLLPDRLFHGSPSWPTDILPSRSGGIFYGIMSGEWEPIQRQPHV